MHTRSLCSVSLVINIKCFSLGFAYSSYSWLSFIFCSTTREHFSYKIFARAHTMNGWLQKNSMKRKFSYLFKLNNTWTMVIEYVKKKTKNNFSNRIEIVLVWQRSINSLTLFIIRAVFLHCLQSISSRFVYCGRIQNIQRYSVTWRSFLLYSNETKYLNFWFETEKETWKHSTETEEFRTNFSWIPFSLNIDFFDQQFWFTIDNIQTISVQWGISHSIWLTQVPIFAQNAITNVAKMFPSGQRKSHFL